MNWKSLQNGSDIRGVALEGMEGQHVNLSADVARAIARAFTAWLVKKNGRGRQTVSVGHDSRLSGRVLTEAFAEGAAEGGHKVFVFGLASTPAMFMSTQDADLRIDGAVMVTASHLPWNRNGMKFFTPEGGLDKEDIRDILALAEKSAAADAAVDKGDIRPVGFMDTYCRFLVDYIRNGVNRGDTPLAGMKIVVDAGNGAGGFFASRVLEPLGADTGGSQFLEPDGTFPNHIPNPEDGDAMASVCRAVKEHRADLGIIFDTDVDRSAVVASTGEPIHRNALIALIAHVVLKEHPGSTIVTDSVTSRGLTRYIAGMGGIHHRFRRGYKNVINESLRLNAAGNESWLAIETSGHAALRENFFLDDGAYLVAKLLVEAARLRHEGRQLQDLIAKLDQPAESREIRLNILDDDFKGYGSRVIEKIKQAAGSVPGWHIVTPNYEGVRVDCLGVDEQGWFLLRQSLHDPVLPLNIESDIVGGVAAIEARVRTLLAGFDRLSVRS